MKYKTHSVKVGNETIGGRVPVLVQSMATVATTEIEEVVKQLIAIFESGASLVRLTVQGTKEANSLPEIKRQLVGKGYQFPLSADIHFSYKTAYIAAEIVEKVRINPGNFVKHSDTELFEDGVGKIRSRFIPLLNICKQRNVALRIGVNHGSLSKRITERYGDTPRGIVASCMEYLDICEEYGFKDVVISIKSSNTVIMINAVRLLVAEMQSRKMSFPLHLGVTEAGEGEDARLKSSVGIGTLLNQNIGDTIRVSLTEPPENEPSVANKIIKNTQRRKEDAQLYFMPQRKGIKIYSDFNKNTFAQVLIDLRNSNVTSLEEIGYLGRHKSIRACDYVIVSEYREAYSQELKQIVSSENYKGKGYPLYDICERKLLSEERLSFLSCKAGDESYLSNLQNTDNVVLIFHVEGDDAFKQIWCFFKELDKYGVKLPVVVSYKSSVADYEDFQIVSATTLGCAFIDRMASGILLQNNNFSLKEICETAFGILQATRIRTTKTEFISCPGCGRTLFDLLEVTEKVKKNFSHLNHLKIAVMGCIVNGPGEMGDADYGYVGAGTGKISLYKGMELQQKNVPSGEAIEVLKNIIKEHGDWKSAEEV